MKMRDVSFLIFAKGKLLMTVVTALSLFGGCATLAPPPKIISSGDMALLDYTCRIEEGEILATTHEEVITAEKKNLSPAFIFLTKYEPATVPVGAQIEKPPKPTLHSLTGELAYRLAQRIVGLTYDETHEMVVSTEAVPELSKMERYIQFSRTMQRPKQRSIPKAQFISNIGKEPKVGEILFADQPIKWQVTDLKEDVVELYYLVEDGKMVKLPFGEAVIRDKGDHIDMEIDTQIGGLVRVGPYIGRISDLTDKLFLVDFEHPFGGRSLTCQVEARQADISVEEVMESASKRGDGITESN